MRLERWVVVAKFLMEKAESNVDSVWLNTDHY